MGGTGMCVIVRAVNPASGAAPWEPQTLTINIPDTVGDSAASFIVAETLRAMGHDQPLDQALSCFCGEPIDLSATLRQEARVAAQTSRRATKTR